MTKRQATTILTLLVVLYAAGLVLLAPRFDLLDFSSGAHWQTAVAVGGLVASPAFLAIWAVHGRQRTTVRVPLTFWLLAIFYLATLYGEVRYFGTGDVRFTFLSVAGWFTMYAAFLLPLRVLRAVRGWRLERLGNGSTQSADDERQRQFTIRTLLGWTAAVAALCAGLRWPAQYEAFDVYEFSANPLAELVEGVIVGLVFSLASLPALSAAWLVLAEGRRIVLRAVLIVITGAGIAGGINAFRSLLDEGDAEFLVLALGIEAGVLTAGLSTALLVRACGYRLVRPSKDVQASAVGPSNVPVPPRRFALACASLAAASVALVCCTPGRFELWRRADEEQAWAEKGWDASFDDNGRVTGLVRLSGPDLSGSEFDLAGLSDLESLGFSHSLITDVQLAQYPIQNPGLARLTSLDLADTPISDFGLAQLALFPGLTHLNLSHTNITDTGIAHLAVLKHLTRLELAVTDVSDEAIESLSRLGQLQSLDLQLTAVSEEGARRLQESLPKATITYGASDASLKEALRKTIRTRRSIGTGVVRNQQKRLHARGRFGSTASGTATTPATRLTDAGLALLSGQTALEELDLRESGVTDAGLTALVKLTSLKRLDLRGVQVTDAGCQKLAKALTNCEIVR
ncbi:MAG TPA: hypothetical protein VG826_26810 [Pirellulales bacterium]|nr:hypothetical protein [Pirellulales bacterium]